jgi:hypothetical protein
MLREADVCFKAPHFPSILMGELMATMKHVGILSFRTEKRVLALSIVKVHR